MAERGFFHNLNNAPRAIEHARKKLEMGTAEPAGIDVICGIQDQYGIGGLNSDVIARLVKTADLLDSRRRAAEHFAQRGRPLMARKSIHILRGVRVRPENIQLMPTSLTVVLPDDEFNRVSLHYIGDELNRPEDVAGIAGTAYRDLYISDRGRNLPVSLVRDGERKDEIIRHEGIHQLYPLLHTPESEDPDAFVGEANMARLYRGESGVNIYRARVRNVMKAHLQIFLDELTAESDRCSANPYEQMFESDWHPYAVHFRKTVETLKKSLPGGQDVRLRFMRELYDQVSLAQKQARRIYDSHMQLRDKISRDELVAHTAMLTPDTGYLMHAFATEEEMTLDTWRKEKAYRQSYRDVLVPEPENAKHTLMYWSKFVGFAIGADEREYEEFTKNVVAQAEFYEAGNPDALLAGIEKHVPLLKKVAQRRIKAIKSVMSSGYMREMVPNDAMRTMLFERVLREYVDFDRIYANAVDSIFIPNVDPVDDNSEDIVRERANARTWQLIEASNAICMQVLEGGQVDWNKTLSGRQNRQAYRSAKIDYIIRLLQDEVDGNMDIADLANITLSMMFHSGMSAKSPFTGHWRANFVAAEAGKMIEFVNQFISARVGMLGTESPHQIQWIVSRSMTTSPTANKQFFE